MGFMEQWLAYLIHNLRIQGSNSVNCKNQKLIEIQPYWSDGGLFLQKLEV